MFCNYEELEWYEDEQIQIIGKDGKVYLVSSFNTMLIGE